jgi:VWFA-related protein
VVSVRPAILALLVAFTSWFLPVRAQQPQPQQVQQAPVFRTSTLLIVQTVTVKDKNGRPVQGLTTKDFVVTEDGVPQQIAFVEYQKLTAPPLGAASLSVGRPTELGAAASAAPIPSVTQVGDTLAAAPLPGDRKYRNKRLIVLYLDLSSLSLFDQGRVFDGVRKYVAVSMTSDDLVSVFVYNQGHVRLKQDFTDDRATLLTTVDAIEQAELDAAQGIVAIEDFKSAFGEDDSTFNMFASDRKLAALQTTVTNLQPFPELKTLVYFGRLNIDVTNMAQVRATVNAAIRSNVTINPVDVSGLSATAPLGNATRASPGGIAMFSGAAAQNNIRRSLGGQDSYYALAKDTGGKALLNNNDLSMGIAQAAQAVTGYYMLGYYTTHEDKDGKFRKVKVSLNGSIAEGADLAYRAGYYGAKEWAKFNSFDKDRQLEEALRLEDPITDIPMAIETNYFQVTGAEYFVPVSVRMPGSELTRPRPAGDTKALIDMVAEIKDEYGVTMRNSRDVLEYKLDATTAAQVARKPIQYETGFTLLPGNYVIKVLARDATTGRIGTFLKSFVIPNLEKEKDQLPISTVVMSSQRVSPADALYTVRQKIAATSANPLVQDGLQLIPGVARIFSASAAIYIYLEAYERDMPPPAGLSVSETAAPPVTLAPAARPLVVFASFYQGGTKVLDTDVVAADSWNPQTRAVPLRLYVAPGQLAPGTYDCQISVLDPASDRVRFWRGDVTIVK